MVWTAKPGKADKRQANNFKDGLDTSVSPFFVSENSLTSGYGFDFDAYPALKVRAGRTLYGASGAATTRLIASLGNLNLMRIVGTTLQYYAAGAWNNIATGLTAGDYDFTNFEVGGVPAVILVTSGAAPKYWNGTTYGTLGGSPPQASYVTNDTVRVWMAKDDILYWSGFLDAADYTSAENSGSVQYFTERGGNITGLKNFYGDKYVWKKDAMAVVQGTNSFNYQLKEISNQIGCVSFRTIQEVAGTLFWLDQNNMYMFSGGLPAPIGEPIRAVLNTINKGAISSAMAWTDKERYYLCIPTGSNTEPDTCLVYSVKARKWLPYSVNVGSLRYGLSFNNVAYCGDASGNTFIMNSGSTDNGVAIPWRVTSRPYDDNQKEAEKELYQMYLQGSFPSGTTLTVEVSPDDIGSAWTTIDYDPLSGSNATVNSNLIIPLDTVPLCNFYSYRLSGSGNATIQEVQRYARIQAVQN